MTPQAKAAATRKRNAEERAHLAIWRRAYDLAQAIQALPDDRASVPDVVALFRPGDGDAFQLLDTRPGQFPWYLNGHWFRLLRIARNDRNSGLFDVLYPGSSVTR